MNFRVYFLIVICLLFSTTLFAENPWSYSLGLSGLNYDWIDDESGNLIQEKMVGLELRGASIRKPTGFYYGSYISIARPLILWEHDELSDELMMGSSRYDMYLSFGLPLGYRWKMRGIPSAFYLGIGPAFQGMFDFDSYLWGSGGLFCEFGFETLKTKGISFSIGGRINIPWVHLSPMVMCFPKV